MHKLRRCIASDNPAKKARLLHGCNLALLGLLLCTTLLARSVAAHPAQETSQPGERIELLWYEGQKVSSVELAGQPDLNAEEMAPLMTLRAGEDFSIRAIDQTTLALQRTGKFTDVQLDVRPEQDGVRVVFVLQPAIYFGMYQFPGAERFPYTRLLQVANYIQQEPYSALDIQRAQQSLITFLRRNGYFYAEVKPEVEVDKANGLANVKFRVKHDQLAEFGDIVIRGTTPDHAADLKGSLRSLRARMRLSAVREGKDFSLKTLDHATRFLESRLQNENYLAAQVKLIGTEYNPETNRAAIHFDVAPGPPVRVHVEGARLSSRARRQLLPVYQQSGLSPELIQEGRQNLLKRFREKGFFDVQVETETQVRPDGIIIYYRIQKGDRRRISDVAFAGNTHVGADELEKHVNVRKAGFLSWGRYDESSIKTLQAFYQSKGFNQVKVTPRFDTNGNTVAVTFVVNEGPQDTVETFQVEGNTSVPLNRLAPDGLRLGPGRPFAQKSIDDDRSRIVSHYLENGYLTATFRAKAEPSSSDPQKFQVVYSIHEGPQVRASNIVTVGHNVTKERLIDRQRPTLHTGRPLTEREILETESRLYATGVFDWAEVNPRRQITSQEQEDVIVKVHESKRNSMAYGFGYEVVNKGGTVPGGTVALPGLPPLGLPPTFRTNQVRVHGPRFNFQYTRNNVRGKAEMVTVSALYGPLDRRAAIAFTDPNFRWTSWTGTLGATAEHTEQNPIFNARLGQVSFQLQKFINAKKTQTLLLRYTFTQTGLSDLVIPELVPQEDLNTRLSTFSAVWIRDTRDSILDAKSGMYDSFEFGVNPAIAGSNANFGKLLGQAAAYKKLNGIVWANSLRVGLLKASSGSRVPLSQRFFTGGGSTLRGFPLNGAGPQTTVPACTDPADISTCAFIRVPTGGLQLLILNSEFRIPVPLKKGLSFVTFYDGGNVFDGPIFSSFPDQYTNTVGAGFRYATPVGPIRVDVGHNLNPISGIKPTQIFISLGQAF
jgi:outer membrane protein assembly factor BamA